MKYLNHDCAMTNITWAAYNNALPVKTMCLSLLYSAPADYSNLYQASNVCQNISSKLAPNNKAVISRDLHLLLGCYSYKAGMKLPEILPWENYTFYFIFNTL